MNGMPDDLFDFNNDGSIDITVRAAELGFIEEIIDDDEFDDYEEYYYEGNGEEDIGSK